MKENDVVNWMYEKTQALLNETGTMGDMEKVLNKVSKEICRKALEHLTQEKAIKQKLICHKCKCSMNVKEHNRQREVITSFGKINFVRSYGFCVNCDEHSFPADAALGLQEHAPASPRIQEISALTTLRIPAGQAETDLYRLTGIKLCASTLHREARRQGERALVLRDNDELATQTPEGVAKLSANATVPEKEFTLIIEIDAWNIRERDNWGQTKILQKSGEGTKRWHWVYTGTVFRLDQRCKTISGRPVISERGYVATRKGLEGFQRQLYAEALQRGMLKARNVLILADGAVWIWNIATDRFKEAKQRVDLYHVKEHLWDLAAELHGKGTEEAREWVRPFLQWLKSRKDGALDIIESLQEIDPNVYTANQQKILAREINYLDTHKNRMDYKNGKAMGEPIGSGAIESTCAQYQRRFKLTGQFWSLAGDEAFLALATIHRNKRWNQLFSHDLN
ncbi:MAG: ISKra4 family transposase [Candidatus Hydrogenedentes bacterium]|nr:ISKra4 family transposase [Candidatus Hydrogenedentota bacterium]